MPAIVPLTLATLGVLLFLAGTAGLLRFPDVYTRLHALTKADNMGLGLVVLAMALEADAWTTVAKLLVTWLLALLAAATACNLIAGAALRSGVKPWEEP